MHVDDAIVGNRVVWSQTNESGIIVQVNPDFVNILWDGASLGKSIAYPVRRSGHFGDFVKA